MIGLIIPGGNAKNGHYIFLFEHLKGRTNYLLPCKKMMIAIYYYRHGSPANLTKGSSQEKIDFANYYLKGFSGELEKLLVVIVLESISVYFSQSNWSDFLRS